MNNAILMMDLILRFCSIIINLSYCHVFIMTIIMKSIFVKERTLVL